MADVIDEAASAAAETEDRNQRRVEILSAAVLGIAGVLTAFAAYKAALTDGDALKGYTESARSTADANGWYNEAFQTFTADQALFVQYAILTSSDPEMAAIVRGLLFSPQLEVATVAWEATGEDGPASPLDMDEYVVEAQIEGEATTALAEEQFESAQKADEAGDKFEFASVFLAISLFLAGVASLFKNRKVRYATLLGSVVFIVPGVLSIVQGQNAL
jgi:hypothetical protein